MMRLFRNQITQDFIKISFGNILEWYDFTIYGLFALQISNAFFPNYSKFLSLLLVFVTFAVSFLARPLGSIVFGLIGDKKGKLYAINQSIWFMAIPTTLIGLIPNYASIGIFAPIILVTLRIMQGISAGGQFSGLITLAVESPIINKAFLASVIYSISVLGSFLASFIGFLFIHACDDLTSLSLFKPIAWRLPFILSAFLFIIYLKVRPTFKKYQPNQLNNFRFNEIFKNQPLEVIAAIMLSATNGTLYYVLFNYLVTYLQIHLNISKEISFITFNFLLLSSVILYPIFGYFAKDIKFRMAAAKKCIVYLIIGVVLFSLEKINIWFSISGLLIMVISSCAITAYIVSLFAEIFITSYRMTACSITFNTGCTIAGFAPLFAELSSKVSILGLPIFLTIVAILLYLTLTLILKTRGYKLAALT